MKNIFLFIILISVFGCSNTKYWSKSSADVIEKGRVETGVFAPVKFGVSKNTELQVRPIAMIKLPNIAVKRLWYKHKNFMFSSYHSIYYVTPLLNFLKKEGTGGLMANDAVVPNAVISDQSLIYTYKFSKNFYFTQYLGIDFAIKGEKSRLYTIDFPYIYPRLSPLYNDYDLYTKFSFDGIIKGDFWYSTQFKFYYLNNSETKYNVEHKAVISYAKSKNLCFDFGYSFTYGRYLYGRDWSLVPMFDVRFGFNL